MKSHLDRESGLCFSLLHWKKSMQFLNLRARTVKQIYDLVHRKTKKDLKCLSMSFASLHSVAFLQCILLLTLEEQYSNLSSFSVLLIN